jgi:hypothetical protein
LMLCYFNILNYLQLLYDYHWLHLSLEMF